MKLRMMTAGFVLGAGAALAGTAAMSQQDHAHLAVDMEAAMAATRPGPAHQLLDQFVGAWNISAKVWFAGPDGPSVESVGTADVKWVLGNRFLFQEMNWVINMPDGSGGMAQVPIQGMGLTGYENHRNLYVSCWADSFNTHFLVMRGAADPTGKRFTYYGEMDEPGLGVTGRMVKYVTRVVDEDTFVFEIVDLHAGDDFKVVEITYSRRA